MLLVKTKVGRSSIAGFGLMAGQLIPKGTPVWTLVRWFDLILTKEQLESLWEAAQERFHNYDYVDMDTGEYILCADEARFLNHSETPNIGWVSSEEYPEEGVDVALRDIQEGEEITINYKNYDADWPSKLAVS